MEETIEFCDTVSYEHDVLLIQNAKIKQVLSLVTDKLIRIDPNLIDDIDFNDVLNDPCSSYKPTGILKEKGIEDPMAIQSEEESPQKYPPTEMPFSVSAGENIGKSHDFYRAVIDFNAQHPSILALNQGDIIKKTSEVDEYYYGQNLRTGTQGFFDPQVVEPIQ